MSKMLQLFLNILSKQILKSCVLEKEPNKNSSSYIKQTNSMELQGLK